MTARRKDKKGFILSYAAVLMSVIVILLVSAVGVLESDIKLLKLEKSKFKKEVEFAQIEEYLLVGNFGSAQASTVGTDFTVFTEYKNERYEITVYEGGFPRLYVERYRGENVKVIYGAKPTE